MNNWLDQNTGNQGVSLPSRYQTISNSYWIIGHYLWWILLLFIPIEIIIRRWDQLFQKT